MLASPVLGPLAREAVRRVQPGSRPEDVVPPIASLPGLPLRIPSPVPIPNFARLYFRRVHPHIATFRVMLWAFEERPVGRGSQ